MLNNVFRIDAEPSVQHLGKVMREMKKLPSMQGRALQSRDAIELLSSKWRVTVLHLLTWGPVRTRELQAAIPQISPKVLTQTLRGLERDGIIKRNVHAVLPPHVEYELTRMGNSVIPLLRNLCRWAASATKPGCSSIKCRRKIEVQR
jgi:DNA-binding HxlR family transcriptional regulator